VGWWSGFGGVCWKNKLSKPNLIVGSPHSTSCVSADYNGANSADYCVVREFPIPAAVGAVAVIDGSNVSSASSSSSSSSSSDSAVNVVEMEILE
jgi:hypothetical protein